MVIVSYFLQHKEVSQPLFSIAWLIFSAGITYVTSCAKMQPDRSGDTYLNVVIS